MRKTEFANGEFYHVYNRGVEKRSITEDQYDSNRFVQSMIEFNDILVTGGIYENSFNLSLEKEKQRPLVNIIAYCINPNHFHFLLEQVADQGISKFIHRLCGGYTQYFNKKHKRSGTLFEGPFKAKHVDTDEYLLRLSAYVNLNDRVHQLSTLGAKLVRSSWREYESIKMSNYICRRDILTKRFAKASEYERFALETLPLMLEHKKEQKELEELFLE